MTTKKKMGLTVVVALLTLLTTSFKTTFQKQTFLKGYQYLVSTNHDTPFKYTRAYSGSGNEFVTKYTIYHPTEGYAAIIVTATHFKAEKKIVVSVDDAGGGIFAHINTEETTYTTPSLESFGFRGDVGALGGDRVPNQLMVKFTSGKFENIKVGNILGSHENNDFEFLVLDEK